MERKWMQKQKQKLQKFGVLLFLYHSRTFFFLFTNSQFSLNLFKYMRMMWSASWIRCVKGCWHIYIKISFAKWKQHEITYTHREKMHGFAGRGYMTCLVVVAHNTSFKIHNRSAQEKNVAHNSFNLIKWFLSGKFQWKWLYRWKWNKKIHLTHTKDVIKRMIIYLLSRNTLKYVDLVIFG